MHTFCLWCKEEYYLTPETELVHLLNCDVFQAFPITEWIEGKPFIQDPENSHIKIEKYPLRVN